MTTMVLAATPLHQDLPVERPGVLPWGFRIRSFSIVFVRFLGLWFWAASCNNTLGI